NDPRHLPRTHDVNRDESIAIKQVWDRLRTITPPLLMKFWDRAEQAQLLILHHAMLAADDHASVIQPLPEFRLQACPRAGQTTWLPIAAAHPHMHFPVRPVVGATFARRHRPVVRRGPLLEREDESRPPVRAVHRRK